MGNSNSSAAASSTSQKPAEKVEFSDKSEHNYDLESTTTAPSTSSDDDCSGSFSDLPSSLRGAMEETEYSGVSEDEDEGELEGKTTSCGVNDSKTALVAVASSPSTFFENASFKTKVYRNTEVKKESVIGDGAFGKVWQGTLRGKQTKMPVAIKAFYSPFDGVGDSYFDYLNTLMELKHRNIVAILGILIDSTDRYSNSDKIVGPKLVLNYFPEGNLIQYLSKPNTPQDYATLVKLALDIIQGCEYLHRKNLIHGNLAARNILVEKQRGTTMTHYNAKISDHGIIQIAKAKGCGRNYKKVCNGNVLPIRWVPKELLDEDMKGFTFASDVWSFGIVVWEIFTKGAVPYGRKKDELKVMELIRDGQSPLDIRIPEGYKSEIIDVMKRIFKVNPIERPTFFQLEKDFIDIFTHAKSLKAGKSILGDKDKTVRRCARGHGYDGRMCKSNTLGAGRRRRGSGCEASERHAEKANGNMFRPSQDNPDGRPLLHEPNPYGSQENSNSNQNMDNTLSLQLNVEGCGEEGVCSGPLISAFHAMSTRPSNGEYAVPINNSRTPPPPYTRNPLPNHSAVVARRPVIRRPPRQREARVNFGREIQKKEEELERLKIKKLSHEAEATMLKMQALVSELTDLKTRATPGGHTLLTARSRIKPHYMNFGARRGRSYSRSGGKREVATPSPTDISTLVQESI